jgi:puromycin-sensitive aminopeptidase
MPPRSMAAQNGAPDEPFRLPRSVVPRHYDLTVDVDLVHARFSGTVAITVELEAELQTITLNAADLSIDGASLELSGGTRLDAEVILQPDQERAVFSLERPAGPGRAVLSCRFEAPLNERLRGLYRSTYVDTHGQSRTIATSQMEPADARRAFPCFDEPDRKAVFEITLIVDEGLQAYSNSPVVEVVQLDNGRRAVRFAPTMVMSTYLVALVVGPFEETPPLEAAGVPVRVVHVPGKGGLASYALKVARHALDYFANYFGIPYPAAKLDLVAVPDFAFGAMENLGCVTFRETALLVDESAAARSDLERVADVVSHELAHMWFGDLVTMRWWEGIWLNEAFATFMGTKCVDAFRPDWERWVSFGMEREAALAVDGLHATRPIEYPVGTPEDAEGMFDVLTYQKGGSVLLMLEHFLGETVFRDGVRRYLDEHRYGNTVTSDLWDALETVSGEPVRAVADSWILQGGHPLVTAKGQQLAQEPFTYQPARGPSAIGAQWSVPVLVRSLAGGDPVPVLLDGPSKPLPELEQPLVINAGGWGAYRTAYEAKDLDALAANLGALGPLERANLFADTWALVLAGREALGRFLRLATHLGNETEPAAFSTVAGALALCRRAVDDQGAQTLAASVRRILGPSFAAFGWERVPGEGERIPNVRSVLLSALGTLGKDPEVRAEALRRFDQAGGGGPPLDPDLEAAVLEVVADHLRPGDYDTCYHRYRAASTPQEELRYLNALAAFPDTELATRTLELALSEVRAQNGPLLITSLLANRVGGPAVFDLLAERFDEALSRFPVNSHARMLQGIRTLCHDRALAEKVTDFLTAHPLRAGQRSVDQAIERLWVNVAFVERERPTLTTTLLEAGPAGA